MDHECALVIQKETYTNKWGAKCKKKLFNKFEARCWCLQMPHVILSDRGIELLLLHSSDPLNPIDSTGVG